MLETNCVGDKFGVSPSLSHQFNNVTNITVPSKEIKMVAEIIKFVTKISNLSVTHLISKIRQQHRCSRNPLRNLLPIFRNVKIYTKHIAYMQHPYRVKSKK